LEIVYPRGSRIGDSALRLQRYTEKTAELRERARAILAGEPDPNPEPQPRPPAGLISDFGYHLNLETGDTRGLDYSEDDERRTREYEARSRRRALTTGANVIGYVNRQAIIARDNSTCHICGQHVETSDIHLDHVIPLARGGEHSADNLRVSHSTCNLSKGARLLN
jgi:HNH endonuclease